MNNKSFYIGLMSGTSADGIDVALVDFSSKKPQLISDFYLEYSLEVRHKITTLYQAGHNEIDCAFSLDVELAKLFADAVNQLLAAQNLTSNDIVAIGNHGQTIRHRPNQSHAFTLQIGCNHTLAALTGIRVIGQFRHKDIAYGGQGAPLVPAFHQANFADENCDVFVVNIGGIANITYLPKNGKSRILGFDTGPGNALLDDWYGKHNNGHYDAKGHWSSEGDVSEHLLRILLADQYFHLKAPKSTGREYFHLAWLTQKIKQLPERAHHSAVDIQATLVALTAASISQEILRLSPHGNVYLCGGGVHNQQLLSNINERLPDHQILLTKAKGIDGDALESIAFAWLAYCYDRKLAGNIPAVTGAKKACILGAEFLP
ncbi:anhydro-N-acetylmuramic acid kinase [Thalassotalea sp. PLHSN55]|uniref:anhydro-N-acetylmuramic acid kinase n=1 Tax=Thalassotalea sp. PLHSN55 TaxID=3435888 RepID=UPI003F831EBE